MMPGELSFLRRVMLGSAQIFSSNALVSLLGLVNTVLFARYLGPGEYGKSLAAMAAVGALIGWGGFGLEDFISIDIARELGEGRDGAAKRLLRQYISIRTGTTVTLVAGFLITAHMHFVPRLGSSSKELGPALLLLVVGRSLGFVTQTAFFSYQQFKLVAGSSIIEAVVRTALALTLIFGAPRSPAFVVFAYGAGALAGAGILVPALCRLFVGQVGNNVQGLRLREALSRHGKWALIFNLVHNSADPVPNLALAAIAGPAALATYRVASRVIDVLQMPITVVGQVLGPVVASSLESAHQATIRVTKYLLALAILLAAGGALLVRPLISVLFPASYARSAVVALVLMPAVVSLALRTRQRPLLYALRRQDLLLISYILLVPLEVGLAGLAATLWGVIGFAVVRSAATFVIFGVREYQLRNAGHDLPLNEVVRMDATDWLVLRRIASRIIPSFGRVDSR